jgi:hypothetical protein
MKKAKPKKELTFRAQKSAFEWSNAEWSRTFLPQIRIASLTIQRDDKELEKVMAGLIESGKITEILEAWLDTTEHLEGITELLNCAMARSSMVLKRMGYESAKPQGVGRKESRT